MKSIIFLLSCFTVILAQSSIDEYWCAVQKKYCFGSPHIACDPNGFSLDDAEGYNIRKIELTQKNKDEIVAVHNQYRNRLASGEYTKLGFPAALKLTEMKWDDTLQFLAEKHAAYGQMKHDGCRATPQYPSSGQNLFQSMTTGDLASGVEFIRAADMWFDEIKVANKSLVTNIQFEHVWEAGHFSVMVNDKNNRIGCGAALFNEDWQGWTFNGILITCNYQYTNMIDTPTYVPGKPCSSCKCSKVYPSLCSSV